MEQNELNRELIRFIEKSPNSFFAVKTAAEALDKAGFTYLFEGDCWDLTPGMSYYTTRNSSALIAFRLPEKDLLGFSIMASHADSPCFKLKPNFELKAEDRFLKLNTERYGGMILSTWFDRPLSIAGRVMIKTETGVESRLVNLDQDLLVIPSLAIHMNREANDGFRFNPQTDLLPLCGVSSDSLKALIAEACGCEYEAILDTDLYLYNREKGTLLGQEGLLCAPRLDDLQCAFASICGLIESKPGRSAAVCALFDNEEVGSGTKQGAAASFLRDVLKRIADARGFSEEDFLRSQRQSFMVSADNAHSVHPNHPEKADPTNRPYLNGGIVIKYSANQKYTTDAVSGAIFRAICEKAGVPTQTFANRSDMMGGSTLGNISNTQFALNTVDIGLAQLAMHSAFETAGANDTAYLVKAAKALFCASIESNGDRYEITYSQE